MAYLPSKKLAIAVAVTLQEGAPAGGNRSIEITKEIAAYLAPESPFDPHGMR
jgi:hypothetical protein